MMEPAEMRPSGEGWVCEDHPGYAPDGLAPSHALNSMAKHNRDHHDAAEKDLEAVYLILREMTANNATRDRQIARAIIDAGFCQVPF